MFRVSVSIINNRILSNSNPVFHSFELKFVLNTPLTLGNLPVEEKNSN